MISIVTAKRGILSVVECATPAPGPTELLVEVKVAGVCGSDVAVHRGPFPGRLSLPRVLGHEWSGLVVQVGRDVRTFSPGDRVVSEEIFWCGSCESCRNGAFDFCERPAELGFTVDGAHASHVLIPERYAHRLPDSVSHAAGALVEPLSVAYNGLFGAGEGIAPGQKVIVTGMGPIGLAAAMWARSVGAQVVGIEPHSYRASLARAIGVERVFEIDPAAGRRHLPPELRSEADFLVEASGAHAVVSPLLESIRRKGTVVLLGHGRAPARLSLETIVLRGLHVVGSCGQVGHNTYRRVIQALAEGVIDPLPMITHRFSMLDARRAFEFALADLQYGKIQFVQDEV